MVRPWFDPFPGPVPTDLYLDPLKDINKSLKNGPGIKLPGSNQLLGMDY
jgi:hypothetical protein